jgi:replicative DNA helicase
VTDPEVLLSTAPPINLEAEQSVLGSMMLERDALDKGIDALHASDFYRPTHQEVFDALVAISMTAAALNT